MKAYHAGKLSRSDIVFSTLYNSMSTKNFTPNKDFPVFFKSHVTPRMNLVRPFFETKPNTVVLPKNQLNTLLFTSNYTQLNLEDENLAKGFYMSANYISIVSYFEVSNFFTWTGNYKG